MSSSEFKFLYYAANQENRPMLLQWNTGFQQIGLKGDPNTGFSVQTAQRLVNEGKVRFVKAQNVEVVGNCLLVGHYEAI